MNLSDIPNEELKILRSRFIVMMRIFTQVNYK